MQNHNQGVKLYLVIPQILVTKLQKLQTQMLKMNLNKTSYIIFSLTSSCWQSKRLTPLFH